MTAGVDCLAWVVNLDQMFEQETNENISFNLLVILQMILASKCSVTYFTQKSFSLRVDQNVSLEFEL